MRFLHATVLTLLLLCPLQLNAAPVEPQAKTFAVFWTKFKAALAQNDKAAVASMTKLPFLFGGRELDRAAFIRRFDSIFDRRTKRCFATKKQVKDAGSYSLFCGETIYIFGKDGDEYKFLEIGVND